MRWRVLLSAPYMQPTIDRFRPTFEQHGIDLLVPPVNERLEEADLLEIIGEVDGVICGDDRFTERVLLAASKLKVIVKWGTGIDSIDKAACNCLNIVLRNTQNAFSEPVADSVLGYILCFARNLPWMSQQMKNGVWHKIPGRSLRECTLGIVGVGNVGKAVVHRAQAFGMRILGNDLLEIPAEFIKETNIEMVGKEDLLREADFISLNCDLNPQSFHFLSDAEFKLMKPEVIIINTSRGPVIDEAALIRALQNKRIAGAALDVFEHEPLPVDSPLRGMDNVLLAPHNSNSSPMAWERVHQNSISMLLEELKARSLQ